ncbi:MAG TPA: fused MFS/spermidine synthase [Solirubrobacteraceae bacterium]
MLPGALAAATVFVASGAVLVLEILSVRLLAPYVGLTLETTTSIIGAVLAGIALGAAVGGWTADRVDPRKLAIGLLVGGGLLVLLTVPIVRAIGPSARGGGDMGALEVTFAALVPLAAVLSAISPTVARLQLRDLRSSGTIVGRLSAWATAGALVGTFGTGFVLVPRFPVSSTVLAIGVALVLAGILLAAYMRLLHSGKAAGTVAGTVALVVLVAALHSPCDAETTYHCALIEIVPQLPAGRLLVLDQEFNSFVEPQHPRYLAFPYTRWIGDSIAAMTPRGAPLNVLFVGGGGFTLPRWLLATRPGSHAHVFEVDGKLVEFDEQRLGLRTSPNMRVTVGDARVAFQSQPGASAEVVVGDAFSGLTIPWQLTTREWLEEVRRVLRPHGIYMLNLIDFRPLKLLRAELATLLGTFANVRMITPAGGDGNPAGGNEVLLASNGPLPTQRGPAAFGASVYEKGALVRLVAGAQPLRDDYAPVDQLETR